MQVAGTFDLWVYNTTYDQRMLFMLVLVVSPPIPRPSFTGSVDKSLTLPMEVFRPVDTKSKQSSNP
jgi:hypothetical protein